MITIKELIGTQNKQEQEAKFNVLIKKYMNDNKREYKGQKLPNGIEITGIGEKCLKIGNNFIEWYDIYEATINNTEDELMKNILAFIFEDYEVENKEIRKFTRTEALQNFEQVKKEIIENKQYYKKGRITGIGETSIMCGVDEYDKEYINWEQIQEVLKTMTIHDYALHKGSTMSEILQTFFIDDNEEETQVEKNLFNKEIPYAEEKAYIYRHILKEDLSVEMIRDLVYDRHSYHTNMDGIEEIINECLQFAFKYQKEVKFTNKPCDDGDPTKFTREYCDEEDANKYAIKNGESYVYIIKNKSVIYDEEKEAYRFEDYKKVIFKIEDKNIIVYRKGKQVRKQPAGRKALYITRRHGTIDTAYELSVEQQLVMMESEGIIKKVTEEEIKEEFIDFIKNNESEMAYELREAIGDKKLKNIEEEYERSLAIQHYAKEMYNVHRVRTSKFYHMLNAITLEDKVNSDLIVDYVLFDDSCFSKATFYEDKYGFIEEPEEYGSKKITLEAGFSSKTYSYMQNCEYTQIEYAESYIDTFDVTTVYLKGDVSEEDAIRLFEYRDGLADVDMKHCYIYEKDGMKIRY